MKSLIFVLIISVISIINFIPSYSCTSIIVTKGASKTGAPMITYSCDGEFHPILRMEKAADYKPGDSLRIWSWESREGYIPQVSHTNKYVGLMNEYQLAIGESTFHGRKELINKKGLIHYWPLMKIALERAKTAREAIKVMTSLAEKYDYAGPGESFSIADKKEAWIMEMVGTGDGGRGAVWVAERIPDGMIAAHANMSRIREFPLNDPENVLYSKNVISFAEKKGYYNHKKDGSFSFSEAYCPPTEEQVRYSARRIWSIFRRVAPSMNISPDWSSYKKGAKPYPLYIKPDKKLGVRDLFALHRDYYEGTRFDMTKNLTSGPFGAPDRWRPVKWEVDSNLYAWERPIATMNAGFVFVSEARPDLPDGIGGIFWYGLDNPYTNFFVPLYTSITSLPKSYTVGSLKHFTRESAWWAFNFVSNYANLRWSYMIKDIKSLQKKIEDKEFAMQAPVEEAAKTLLRNDKKLAADYLTHYCVSNAEENIKSWWGLGDMLITKYNDGYIQDENGRPRETGYPESWLGKEVKENPEKFRLHEEKEAKGDL